MEKAQNPRTRYMMIVFSIMFLAAAAVTLSGAFLLVEKDRGFIFWFTVGFIVFVEMTIYSFGLGLLVAKTGTKQVSTPVIATSSIVLALYVLVGSASIIIYSVIREADKPADKSFVAIFIIETALAFLLILFIRSWDLFFQSGQAPFVARREAHRIKGMTLQPLLEEMRVLRISHPDLGVRLDRITKRLEAVHSSLLHSHGGGVGSPEGGCTHVIDPAVEEKMVTIIEQMNNAIEGSNDDVNIEHRVDDIERMTEHLQDIISSLQLE